MPLPVSILIPAHNAAATLADTLASVCNQTSPDWEAIVVENGSTDDTAALAREWAARDRRIRVAQSAPGVSVARNAGIGLARFPWLLFLDADDWILPTHLERLTAHLADNPELDAAHCGWRRIGPDGASMSEEFGPGDRDLFPRFAHTCAIVIHSCVTRRSLIQAAGSFDTTLRTCEDWDLWQRIARMGCRFGAVHEALACYRVRPGSASMNAAQLVSDSRQVIKRGFSSDPRVSQPRPEYAAGLPAGDQHETLLYTVAWAAGLAIGGQRDATPLLDLVDAPAGITLDPFGLAGCIHCCAMLPLALPVSAWADQFDALDSLLLRFLEAMEARTQQKGLARSAYTCLLRMVLDGAVRPRPFTVGHIHAARIEITEPIPDFVLPEKVERLHGALFVENEPLGVLELPVIDGSVPAGVLSDAIAAEFAWPLVERFLSRSVYPSLFVEKLAEGWRIQREGRLLASQIAGNGTISWADAHAQIGWTVFLQEAWGAPRLSADDFYHGGSPENGVTGAGAAGNWLVHEISDPLPGKWTLGAETTAVLTVGGAAVVEARLPNGPGEISGRAVRAALTTESGFELCCACVREGLLGRPLREPKSLRARLAESAARRRAVSTEPREVGGFQLLPVASSVLEPSMAGARSAMLLPRRIGPCGSSVSRRALLPAALVAEIAAARAAAREPVLRPVDSAQRPERIVYAPELLWHRAEERANRPVPSPAAKTNPFGRHFFEQLFHDSPNPWLYQTPYEQTKYEQTLALLPRARFGRVLELACAEGHFTAQLAPRAERVLATDFSPTAVQRAAERCRRHAHVEFAELDLLNDPLPGRFDLIVCSEVLYYTGTVTRLRAVTAKIAAALEPGGYFVTAHAHLVVDEPHRAGFDWDLPFGAKRISDVLAQSATLRLVKDLRTPLYRIQVYQRHHRLRRWFRRPSPERIALPQPTDLPPHVAAHALWRGGVPQRFSSAEERETRQLPILMYHRIAPDGATGQERYRVSPDAFDAQLALLARLGFRGVLLDEWRRAMQARRPLPGRCVALTFDDGYRDFLDHAWPRLQHHGFRATVFLPTAHVGGRSQWDAGRGEAHPLLGWDEIRRLRGEGVEFGSHSATHPILTCLSPVEIAREALISRTVLERHLGGPVTSFAYPYGECDKVVQRMVGACGYTVGLTCREAPAELTDALLALPRWEMRGDMTLRTFEELLSGS